MKDRLMFIVFLFAFLYLWVTGGLNKMHEDDRYYKEDD